MSFLKDFLNGQERRIFLNFYRDGVIYHILMLTKIEKEVVVVQLDLLLNRAQKDAWEIQENICSKLPE